MPRHRRRDEFATPATIAAAATITGIVFDADGENSDGRRVLIVHLRGRAQQNTPLRERPLVPAGFAEAIISEPLFVQQDTRYIEVADER